MDPTIYNILENNRKPRFRGNKKSRAPVAGYKDHPSIPWQLKEDFTPSPCIYCSDVQLLKSKHISGTRNVLLEKPRVSSVSELLGIVELHRHVKSVQINEGQLEELRESLNNPQDRTILFVIDSFDEIGRAVLWRIFNLCGRGPVLVEENSSSWQHQLFECSPDIHDNRLNIVCLESRPDWNHHLQKLVQLQRVSFVPISISWDIPDSAGKRTARVNFGRPVALEEFQKKCLANQHQVDLCGYVEAHLRHDIVRNRAVMPTSLVALMLHFGLIAPGTCGKKARDLFDGLVYDIRSRGYDLGFRGKTEHVLEYSTAVLERNWNTTDRFGTAWNAARPFLCDGLMISAILSILGGSLQSEEEPELRENDLLEVFKELMELFKFEAQLTPPCLQEEKKFEETLQYFVTNGVLSYKNKDEMEETEDERRARRMARHFELDDDDAYDDGGDMFFNPPVPTKPQEIILFVNKDNLRRYSWLRKIWAPIVDTYYETALKLLPLLENDVMEDEDIIGLVMEEIRSKLERKLLVFEESASTVFIRNALKFFQEIQVLDSYTHSGINVLYLQPLAKQEEVIFDLAAQIGKFRF